MNHHSFSLEINNRTLSIEINKVATQADGSALLQYGETVMFVSCPYLCGPSNRDDGLDNTLGLCDGVMRVAVTTSFVATDRRPGMHPAWPALPQACRPQ